MLTLFLLTAAMCSEPFVSVHLAVSEDRSTWPAFGPEPRITSCAGCEEVGYSIAGRAGKVRIVPKPLLQISGVQVRESQIVAETDLYDPEKLYYQLLLLPNDDLLSEIGKIIDDHWNDRVVMFNCSDVTQIDWITPLWKRNIPVGIFESRQGARTVANRLGIKPEVIPFDRDKDEASRVEYLRAIFREYAGQPNPRQQIAREKPELHRFLEKYPSYWNIFEEESEAAKKER